MLTLGKFKRLSSKRQKQIITDIIKQNIIYKKRYSETTNNLYALELIEVLQTYLYTEEYERSLLESILKDENDDIAVVLLVCHAIISDSIQAEADIRNLNEHHFKDVFCPTTKASKAG